MPRNLGRSGGPLPGTGTASLGIRHRIEHEEVVMRRGASGLTEIGVPGGRTFYLSDSTTPGGAQAGGGTGPANPPGDPANGGGGGGGGGGGNGGGGDLPPGIPGDPGGDFICPISGS